MASKVKLIIECYEQTYEECKRIQGLSETAFVIANGTPYNPIIRCKDCKYQVKQFVPDKRYKEGGYWESGCSNLGARCGYWAFGGADDEFCSDAEPKEGDCL